MTTLPHLHRRPATLILASTLACSVGDAPTGGWGAVDVVIENVSVITMEGDSVRSSHAIAVEGERIVWIGPETSVPRNVNAERVDGGDRYVIPGLIDAHVHTAERDFPLYVAAGVTTVLFKHGDYTHLAWRDRAERGELLAPRLYTTGPLIAGRAIRWPHVVAQSADQADSFVREQASAGYDFIKVYDLLSRDAYDGLARAAREMDIPFVGHVPEEVGVQAALDAGQACIDHADQLLYAEFGRERSMEIPADDATRIAALFAERDVCFVTTLFGMMTLMRRGTSWFDSLFGRPEMTLVDPGTRDWWSSFRTGTPGEEAAARRNHFFETQRALTRALHDAGVPIVAGTDAPNLLLIPGFSLHDELSVLVDEVGLTPIEALRTATVNAAAALGAAETLGRIVPGQSADFVVVDENPLLNLNTIRRPWGVMLRGRWLDHTMIDSLLAAARTATTE